jgi:molecular chaperone GrpE
MVYPHGIEVMKREAESYIKRPNAHAERRSAEATPPTTVEPLVAVGPERAQTDQPPPAAASTAAAESLVPVEVATVTQEQLAELKEQAARAEENWERLLRTTADLENFKKRAARDKQEAIKYANEALLRKLVPVVDNFDMALAAAQTAGTEAGQSLQAGISLIFQQFKSVLAEAGLEEVDAAGKQFDPKLHEAISQEERSDVPEGQVVQQLRKGYKLRDRLLRPASVVVAKQPVA